jgi:hypothetical protein
MKTPFLLEQAACLAPCVLFAAYLVHAWCAL